MTFSAGSGLLQDDRLDGGEPDVEEHAPRRDRARACSCWTATTAATGACAAPTARAGRSTTRCSTATSGTIYAAAASEWLGSAIWRSPDLGETWEHSSEGLGYPEEDGGLRLSKVSHVMPAHGRLLVGGRVGRAVREHRRRQDLLAPDDVRRPGGPRGLERPGAAAARPPRPLGDHPAPGRARPLLGDRPGLQPVRDERRRQDVGAAQQGAAQGLARRLRGDRLLRPQGRAGLGLRAHVPAEPRRHAPQRRRRQVVDGDHGGPADRVRLRRRDAPARPRHLLRDPARPGSRPDDARRQGSRLAHARRRLELAAARSRACRQRTRTSASCARGWRSTAHDEPGLYFGTSTGQLYASTDEGESWDQIGGLFPGITSVTVADVD